MDFVLLREAMNPICRGRLTTLVIFFFTFFNTNNLASSNNVTTNEVILINCGATGNSTDDDDRTWTGDGDAIMKPNGTAYDASSSISSPDIPTIPYATARVFSTTYTYPVPVKHDRYLLRLYFYPSDYGNLSASHAVFDVSCSPYTLLNNFSTYDYAQALKSDYMIREYSLNVSSHNGWLNITFSPSANVVGSYAFVNGIELISVPNMFSTQIPTHVGTFQQYNVEPSTAMETMYRLNVGGSTMSLAKDSGPFYRKWAHDSIYIAGGEFGISFSKDRNVTIKYNEDDPEYIAPEDVYATARSMAWYNSTINLNYNMSWILSVDPGFDYLVRLHFCEIMYPFTSSNQRVFTIFINEGVAYPDFDIGAKTKAIGVPVYFDSVTSMASRNNTSDQQVDLWVSLGPYIQFHPAYTNVILNGLEVFKLNDTSGNLAGPQLIPKKASKHKPITGGIVGGVCSLLLIGSILLCGIYYRLYWHKETRSADDHATDQRPLVLELPLHGDHCRRFTFTEMKAATEDFDEKRVLGVGGFGKVYHGTIQLGGTMEVAIKRSDPTARQGIHEFLTEIQLLSKVRHPHLVSLVGYCNDGTEMILVYEYMAHGTLRSHLYNMQSPPLTWKQRLEICVGAARGLHYLHTGADDSIIHRDVKTTNILLDENWTAKVSDFGLSKMVLSYGQTHVSTAVKGTFGYLDPEYFWRQKLTDRSDVYSFRVVLLEVLCARPAVIPELPVEQASLGDWALRCVKKGMVYEILDPNLKGKVSPQCLKIFVETAVKCLRRAGRDRPPMSDVLWSLEFAMQLHKDEEEQNSEESNGGANAYDPDQQQAAAAAEDINKFNVYHHSYMDKCNSFVFIDGRNMFEEFESSTL